MGAKRQGDRHGDGPEAQRHSEEDDVALCINHSRLDPLLCLLPSGCWALSRNFMDGLSNISICSLAGAV